MGTKRTHAETKDGSKKPSPAKNGLNGKQHRQRDQNDRKDKRRNGEEKREGSGLLFTPQPEWHTVPLPELPVVENPTIPSRPVLDALHEYADKLLEEEATQYATTHMAKDSSHKFMSTIMASGTMEDKVSALTLLVQASPLHTQKAFLQLLGLSQKKSRNSALMALSALKDLLGQGVVLPPERKLKAFARQPALISALQGKAANWKAGEKLPGELQKLHLVAWAYEDWLKKQFFEMLKIIEFWSNDEVQYSRSRALTMVWELLKEKPEQEENLLRLLINKLGDKEKKVASKASHLLLQLQISHPLMKGVIIDAIESDLLFKPNQSPHAKYYAIITLNSTVLSAKEQQVADKLLDTYFSLFVGLLRKDKERAKQEKKLNKDGLIQGGGGKPGKMARKKAKKLATQAYKAEDEVREKLIAGILTGVNRAFPFANLEDAKFEEHIDTIFKVTHSSNFNTSIQAMMLIQQISAMKHISTDRFYRTLYESLLDPRLLTTSKQILYLNLLYRSLKADVSIRRVQAFVKRLLQVIQLHEPPFICGVLYLINELITTFPIIKTMLSTPEDHDSDGEEEHYEDAQEDPAAKDTTHSKRPRYDPRKRDPEYANADLSCLWELLPLQAHHHPSVAVLARKLLNQDPINEKPDPTLYTLMNFLDKFAFRNAKLKNKEHGSSIMQPMSGTSKASDYLVTVRDGDRYHDPVNSEQFWKKKAGEVRVDEAFFHAYFERSGKAKQTSKKQKKKNKKGKDDDSEDSGEDEVWKALVNSRPDIEGDDNDDDGFSDFDMGSDDDDEADGDMDGGVELNLGSDDDEAPGPVPKHVADDDEEMGEGDFDLDDDEAEAFVGSDEEIPEGFDFNDDTDIEDHPPPKSRKGGKDGDAKEDKKGRKKRKLKHLPTFASAEDYAKLIGDDESE